MDKVAEVGDTVFIGNVELKVLEIQKMRVSKVLIKKESENKECTED